MLKLPWAAMQKWCCTSPRGKFPLWPRRLPAWMPLSCLWGKPVAAWRSEVQCTMLPAVGMGPGTPRFTDLPETLLLLQPRDGTNRGGCCMCSCSVAADWAQGKLDEVGAGFHSSDKCTGREEGCRGASPHTAPCTAQSAEPHTAGTGKGVVTISAGGVAACCPAALCKGICVLFWKLF